MMENNGSISILYKPSEIGKQIPNLWSPSEQSPLISFRNCLFHTIKTNSEHRIAD